MNHLLLWNTIAGIECDVQYCYLFFILSFNNTNPTSLWPPEFLAIHWQHGHGMGSTRWPRWELGPDSLAAALTEAEMVATTCQRRRITEIISKVLSLFITTKKVLFKDKNSMKCLLSALTHQCQIRLTLTK